AAAMMVASIAACIALAFVVDVRTAPAVEPSYPLLARRSYNAQLVSPTASNSCCFQSLSPAAPYPIWGVDSAAGSCACGEVGWDARGMIPWQEYAQGEYVGHAAHHMLLITACVRGIKS